MKYLIIGNGIAGVSAAEAIREIDRSGEIIMVGDEALIPYSRPMISYVLEGSQPHRKLPIRDARFYDTLRIKPILGQRARGLDVGARSVALEDGTELAFDRLLIASGADPRSISAENAHLEGVFHLRTEADVRRQLEALGKARRAVVLGGGLVGFKAAYALLRRGLQVTMLITSPYPLSMQVDGTAGRMVLDVLRQNGLDVRVGLSVVAFEGNGEVKAAITDQGDRLPCDLVIVGKGVSPAHAFVPREHLQVDLGILVDQHQETNVPGIYAAGDVAECTDIARGCRAVNAIWPEAAAQGRAAGFNMAGRPVAYPGSLSRNTIRIYDMALMTVGHVNPLPHEECRVLRSGGSAEGWYRSLVLRGDVLVGAVLLNHVEQGGILRALIENRVPLQVDPAALMSPAFHFGRLMP